MLKINLFEREFKVSQYADDPSLYKYIEPSERTLRVCLITLNEFHKILELEIDIGKTKVVKVGGWRNRGITKSLALSFH